MDFNKIYLEQLEIVKKSVAKKTGSDSMGKVAELLGKNSGWFTNRKVKKKPFTKEDLVWLQFVFNDVLENPIVKNIEVVNEGGSKEKAGNESNSDQPGQRLKSLLAELQSNHKEALQKIDQALSLLPQVPGSGSGTAEPIVKRRVQAFVNTAVGTDSKGTGTEGQKKK